MVGKVVFYYLGKVRSVKFQNVSGFPLLIVRFFFPISAFPLFTSIIEKVSSGQVAYSCKGEVIKNIARIAKRCPSNISSVVNLSSCFYFMSLLLLSLLSLLLMSLLSLLLLLRLLVTTIIVTTVTISTVTCTTVTITTVTYYCHYYYCHYYYCHYYYHHY